MLLRTNFGHAPWHIVKADDKHETHINLISHLLSHCDYKHKDEKALAHTIDIVYPATPENIKEKLF
jgi:hypothetical protein